jgi:ATP-dependent Lon protease
LWFVILVVISITIERITKKIYDNYCPDLIWRDPSRQEFLERKRECLSTLEEVYKLEERQSDISKQKIKKDIAKAVRRNVNLEDKELIINAATKAIEQFPEFDEVTAKPDRSRIARQVEGIRYENLRKKSIGVCYLCYGLIVIASVSSVCAFVILILPLVS